MSTQLINKEEKPERCRSSNCGDFKECFICDYNPIKPMTLKKAKEIIEEFLDNQIEQLIEVLGREHPYYDTTVGELEEANCLLSQNNIFN